MSNISPVSAPVLGSAFELSSKWEVIAILYTVASIGSLIAGIALAASGLDPFLYGSLLIFGGVSLPFNIMLLRKFNIMRSQVTGIKELIVEAKNAESKIVAASAREQQAKAVLERAQAKAHEILSKAEASKKAAAEAARNEITAADGVGARIISEARKEAEEIKADAQREIADAQRQAKLISVDIQYEDPSAMVAILTKDNICVHINTNKMPKNVYLKLAQEKVNNDRQSPSLENVDTVIDLREVKGVSINSETIEHYKALLYGGKGELTVDQLIKLIEFTHYIGDTQSMKRAICLLSFNEEIIGKLPSHIIKELSVLDPSEPKLQTLLGFCYEKGVILEKDLEKAAEFYKKAADQDCAEAQYSLGYLYCLGLGVPRSYSEARRYFELAAAQDSAVAQTYLGDLYRHGYGVIQSYSEAKKYYEKAAARGLAGAQYNLGFFYNHGFGVLKSYSEAKKYFELAAAQNYCYGLSSLGLLYENGFGVEQDYNEAKKLYEKALAQGDVQAKEDLDRVTALIGEPA